MSQANKELDERRKQQKRDADEHKSADFLTENQRNIRIWLDELIAYDNRTANGVVKGINNKLKLIKRSDYGFTNQMFASVVF